MRHYGCRATRLFIENSRASVAIPYDQSWGAVSTGIQDASPEDGKCRKRYTDLDDFQILGTHQCSRGSNQQGCQDQDQAAILQMPSNAVDDCHLDAQRSGSTAIWLESTSARARLDAEERTTGAVRPLFLLIRNSSARRDPTFAVCRRDYR